MYRMIPPNHELERLVKLEVEQTHFEKLLTELREAHRTDFRLLISAIAASTIGLATLIASSAGWL